MSVTLRRRASLIAAIAAVLSATCLMAQVGGGAKQAGTGQRAPEGRMDGGPGQGNRPPKPPLEIVLDANQDGTIDADEIAKAPAALKKLDKNGDGKLTPDEYRPSRRRSEEGRGPAGGPGGDGPGRDEQPSSEAK